MVQKENVELKEEEEHETVIIENPPKGIPCGKYRLIGWDIDTNGKRLIDEICQIASYTPKAQFGQYIMPYADINPWYIRKHGIRVVSAGRYRMLKNLRSNSFIKTKSEVTALMDFLQWLEDVNGDGDGIILVYYEARKSNPGMLLEALRRYNLIERFCNSVKGFCNGFNIAQDKCGNTTKSFQLRVMAKILLDKDKLELSSAVERARCNYEIAVHLAQGEREELGEAKAQGDAEPEPHIVNFICPYTNPISAEEEDIQQLKELLKVQNTFKPVFGNLLKASRQEREKASHLRRLLAKNNVDYEKLKEAFESEAKEGIDKVLKHEVTDAKEADLAELLEILDCFFDPEKKAIQPKRRYNRRASFNPRQRRHSYKKKTPHSPSSDNNPTNDNSPRIQDKTAPPHTDDVKA